MFIIPKTENIISIPINPQTRCFLLSVLMFSSAGFKRYLTIPYRKRMTPSVVRNIISGFTSWLIKEPKNEPELSPLAKAMEIKLKSIN